MDKIFKWRLEKFWYEIIEGVTLKISQNNNNYFLKWIYPNNVFLVTHMTYDP